MTTVPDTVVLIHGLWMTARSWEHWADRYSAQGFNVIAEGWPGLDVEVEELKRDPAPIAAQSIDGIVEHYARIIVGLERPPIIIGHSFGGAFTQVLLDRGLGAAGVAISSAAVKGIRKLPWSTLRTGWPILRNPANRHRAVPINLKQFHYRFTNHLSVRESEPDYQRYCVPGAGRVLFEGAMANFRRRASDEGRLRNHQRPPVLLIAGGIDHVSPPSLVKANLRRYRNSQARTEYQEYPGRSHLILGQDGWEQVADFALNWSCDAATTNPHQPTTNS